jgi:hypothetical protein
MELFWERTKGPPEKMQLGDYMRTANHTSIPYIDQCHLFIHYIVTYNHPVWTSDPDFVVDRDLLVSSEEFSFCEDVLARGQDLLDARREVFETDAVDRNARPYNYFEHLPDIEEEEESEDMRPPPPLMDWTPALLSHFRTVTSVAEPDEEGEEGNEMEDEDDEKD